MAKLIEPGITKGEWRVQSVRDAYLDIGSDKGPVAWSLYGDLDFCLEQIMPIHGRGLGMDLGQAHP